MDTNEKTFSSLADALVACFEEYLEEYYAEMHDDNYVKRVLKDFVGAKEYKKYEELDDKVWYDAWREFDLRTFKRQ